MLVTWIAQNCVGMNVTMVLIIFYCWCPATLLVWLVLIGSDSTTLAREQQQTSDYLLQLTVSDGDVFPGNVRFYKGTWTHHPQQWIEGWEGRWKQKWTSIENSPVRLKIVFSRVKARVRVDLLTVYRQTTVYSLKKTFRATTACSVAELASVA